MNEWERYIPAGLNKSGAWQGALNKKPWEYQATAVIPHLNTPELLAVNIALLRAQTIKPYILIIDTGSCASQFTTAGMLEPFRASDVEIHYLGLHGFRNSSEAVTMAMDAAMALCQTDYLYCTHADALLMRPDYIADLKSLIRPLVPAVGYEMSERSWLTDDWRGMVSHTATLLHVPTLRAHGVSWNMRRAYDEFGCPQSAISAWPDTETAFNHSLRKAGLSAHLIGNEANYKRQTDANIDHIRSYPSLKRCNADMHEQQKAICREAIEQGWQRVMAWKNS